MRTSAPGSKSRGFTLIELMVVVAIIAIASAGVVFALRDSGNAQLEREGLRLAALLESARAQSRASGTPVRWRPLDGGFRFEGLPAEALPRQWLSPDTRALSTAPLVLGPEPLIEPQAVELASAAQPTQRVRVASDGLRPFTATPVAP